MLQDLQHLVSRNWNTYINLFMYGIKKQNKLIQYHTPHRKHLIFLQHEVTQLAETLHLILNTSELTQGYGLYIQLGTTQHL